MIRPPGALSVGDFQDRLDAGPESGEMAKSAKLDRGDTKELEVFQVIEEREREFRFLITYSEIITPTLSEVEFWFRASGGKSHIYFTVRYDETPDYWQVALCDQAGRHIKTVREPPDE